MKSINLKPTIATSFLCVGIMYLLYFLTQAKYFGDNPVGQGTNFDTPLIVPEPYAFAIWGVIYTGLTIFPIYQWFKRSEGHPLWKKVHYWFSANVIVNGLWLAAASMDWMVTTVVLIVFMLVTLYKINEYIREIDQAGDSSYWPEKFVFSIYFAWITLATALNITAALVFYNWSGFGIDGLVWSNLILIVAAMIAAAVFFKYKDGAYAGVVVWAFIALVVKHISANPSIAYLSIGVAIIFAAFVFLGTKQRLATN